MGDPELVLGVVGAPIRRIEGQELLKLANRQDQRFRRASTEISVANPQLRVGSAIREQVFPDAYEEALAGLPDDHWLQETMVDYGPDYGNRPEWDIYMFFGPEAEWTVSPPRPIHFVRHVGRVIETDKGRLSLMWIDDYSKPPVEGELKDAIARIKKEIDP